MSGNGDARRRLLSEPVSEEERNIISHPPAGIEENDVEQGCAAQNKQQCGFVLSALVAVQCHSVGLQVGLTTDT